MMTDRPLFDRYLPLRAFQGERSVVYLCADLLDHCPAALETFHEPLVNGTSRAGLMQRCADWVRIDRHPHVVGAREVQRDDTSLAIVADFVDPLDGMPEASLRGMLGAPLSIESACWLALGIVRGMRHAVECVPGLVHGDLSPDNVLVGRDHRAKVCGFGLAGLAGSEATAPQRFAGPEWSEGQPDTRADVYAFGLIFLELIAGETGLPTDDAMKVAAAHREGLALRRARHGDLPAALVPMVEACLQPSPSARPGDWASVEEMLVAVWPDVLGGSAPALPAAEDAEREHRLLEGWARQAMANALWEHGQLCDALDAYESVLRVARSEKDRALEADALGGAGRVMYAAGNLERAASTLVQAMELKRDLGDLRGQATALVAIGDVSAKQGNTDEALVGYFAAARLFAEQGDRRGSATARLHMAPVLEGVGRQTEARNAAAESRALFEEAGDVRGEGLAWSAQARLLRGAGSLDESLASSRMAVERSNACGDRGNAAKELSLHAQTLTRMQLIPEAIDQFAQAVRASEEAGDSVLRADNLRCMAALLLGNPVALVRGRACAELAAALYRTAGRDDLASDAEQLAMRFDE